MECFPDGSPMEDFFFKTEIPDRKSYGRPYVITDHGIRYDGRVYTEAFQRLIDLVYEDGGGVIIVPPGVYKTGALYFKPGVNLYIEEEGTLLGSEDIWDYPLVKTRIEGETCLYFPALINVEHVDGFMLGGQGTIDGNGWKSWKAFWLRWAWNPDCTNKDEQRPRLIYLSDCNNATLSGVTLQNSHFWTCHIYRCDHIRFLGLRILSPAAPVNAPSTDAIDIDASCDILIRDCYMAVNDDAIALKGGKGRKADRLCENGANERILIEDCEYGFCHSCLTFGSESLHDKNIIMRRIRVSEGYNLLWLKFRPDTLQHYEYCRVTDIEGKIDNFIQINRWTQFADEASKERPLGSKANDMTISKGRIRCRRLYHIPPLPADFSLSAFEVRDLHVECEEGDACLDFIEEVNVKKQIIS